MKEVNFDWLLQGCHPLSEVAQAYFPCMHNSSAVRSFRKTRQGNCRLVCRAAGSGVH